MLQLGAKMSLGTNVTVDQMFSGRSMRVKMSLGCSVKVPLTNPDLPFIFRMMCQAKMFENLAPKLGFFLFFLNLYLVKTKIVVHQMGSNLLHSNLFDVQQIIFGFFKRNFEKLPIASGRTIFLQKNAVEK
jgi:hypothetical protein